VFVLSRGVRVRRRVLGSAFLAVGALLLLLSVGTVAYAQWAEWQHALQQPPGPRETLPERLEIEASQALIAPAPRPPAPETAATPGPSPAPGADDGWDATLPPLDAVWESDWPEALALLDAFHARFPDHAAANEKLYAALVSYGRALIESDRVAEGIAQLERAQGLLPGRGEAPAALLAPTAAATPVVSPTPEPSAAPRPSYGRPAWIKIPRIGVDSSVMEVGVRGGEYEVPAWDVGYHADSAEPGEPGNSVFNGHLETIDAGRVFARLKELAVGDAVYVYTGTHRLDWVVEGVRTVPTADHSFILPTPDARITLYTCAGRYNPLTRDYTHRLAVVGRLVKAVQRT